MLTPIQFAIVSIYLLLCLFYTIVIDLTRKKFKRDNIFASGSLFMTHEEYLSKVNVHAKDIADLFFEILYCAAAVAWAYYSISISVGWITGHFIVNILSHKEINFLTKRNTTVVHRKIHLLIIVSAMIVVNILYFIQ